MPKIMIKKRNNLKEHIFFSNDHQGEVTLYVKIIPATTARTNATASVAYKLEGFTRAS